MNKQTNKPIPIKINPEMAEVFGYFLANAWNKRIKEQVAGMPKGAYEQSKQEFFDRHI